MYRNIFNFLAITALMISALPAATISLTPGNNRTGTPGSTVSWGYSLNNDTANWIVINSIVPSFSNPGFGTFTELATSNFNVVAPNTVFADIFGDFAISPGATVGDFTIGTFSVGYDTYSSDPLLDGGAGYITGANTFADFNGRVDAISDVPEPTTGALLALFLAGGFALKRRK